MKGNLTIDIGNTQVKVAFFIGEQLVATNRFERRDIALLERTFSNYKPDTVTFSSVSGRDERIEEIAHKRGNRVLWLSHETPLPIRLDYLTPTTLGTDRIATSVGAWTIGQRLSPTSDLLVIDAGTAVTYDLVTSDGKFKGGNIAPGMRMRFTALHEHTRNLPLIEPEGPTPVVGYDTETAIRSGVVLGLCNEIEHYIQDLRLSHPDMLVLLTGGDGKFLKPLLHSEVLLLTDLLSHGLNRIFLYNEQYEAKK